jgi:hypothetical protein
VVGSVSRLLARLRVRPSFMTVTIAVALLASPSFGLLASRLNDSKAMARELAHEADARLREEQIERGWEPLATAPALPHARELLTARGIEILAASRGFRLELAGGTLAGDRATELELERGARLLKEELLRYPARFLQQSRLRRVVLTRSLSEGGASIPSLPNVEGALVIDTDASEDFLRRLIHHEVFHFVDYAGDDQLKRDPAWQRLNDRWFVYGSGGRYARTPGSGRLTADLPGFVSRYATSALEEDKAETFAFLMAAPVLLDAIAARDAVIQKKIVALRAELEEFCPEIDGRFWARGGSI